VESAWALNDQLMCKEVKYVIFRKIDGTGDTFE
jgi:hypothetical protein